MITNTRGKECYGYAMKFADEFVDRAKSATFRGFA